MLASLALEPLVMPQIAADPPWRSCYRLFSGSGIQEFQRLGPDLLLLRTRALRQRSFRQRAVGVIAAGGQGLRYNRKKNLAADSTIVDSLRKYWLRADHCRSGPCQ